MDETLINQLRDGSPSQRRAAAIALAKLGELNVAMNEFYLPELTRASEDWYGVYTDVKQIGGPAVEALSTAVFSNKYLLRGRAISLLGEIGDKRALDALQKAANITPEDFRQMGTEHTVPEGTEASDYVDRLFGRTPTSQDLSARFNNIPLSELLDEYRKKAKDSINKIEKGRDSK